MENNILSTYKNLKGIEKFIHATDIADLEDYLVLHVSPTVDDQMRVTDGVYISKGYECYPDESMEDKINSSLSRLRRNFIKYLVDRFSEYFHDITGDTLKLMTVYIPRYDMVYTDLTFVKDDTWFHLEFHEDCILIIERDKQTIILSYNTANLYQNILNYISA